MIFYENFGRGQVIVVVVPSYKLIAGVGGKAGRPGHIQQVPRTVYTYRIPRVVRSEFTATHPRTGITGNYFRPDTAIIAKRFKQAGITIAKRLATTNYQVGYTLIQR